MYGDGGGSGDSKIVAQNSGKIGAADAGARLRPPRQWQREEQEQPRCPNRDQWLANRNMGYFSKLPPSFMAILLAMYIILRVLVDRAVYFFAADCNADVSLQLGGVCAIGWAFWEVGGLSAKEKPEAGD